MASLRQWFQPTSAKNSTYEALQNAWINGWQLDTISKLATLATSQYAARLNHKRVQWEWKTDQTRCIWVLLQVWLVNQEGAYIKRVRELGALHLLKERKKRIRVGWRDCTRDCMHKSGLCSQVVAEWRTSINNYHFWLIASIWRIHEGNRSNERTHIKKSTCNLTIPSQFPSADAWFQQQTSQVRWKHTQTERRRWNNQDRSCKTRTWFESKLPRRNIAVLPE